MPSVPLARKLSSPVLVEQTASNQVALHLPKLLHDFTALCSTGPPLHNLVLCVLSVTEIRRRDPRSSVLGPRSCTSPPVESATAGFLVGRTLTRGPPPGLSTASLTQPIRPEPPFDSDSDIIFCKHLNTPIMRCYNTANLVGFRGRSFLEFMWNQIRDK